MQSTCQDQTGSDLDGATPVQHLKGHFWKVFAVGAGAHASTGHLPLLQLCSRSDFKEDALTLQRSDARSWGGRLSTHF